MAVSVASGAVAAELKATFSFLVARIALMVPTPFSGERLAFNTGSITDSSRTAEQVPHRAVKLTLE